MQPKLLLRWEKKEIKHTQTHTHVHGYTEDVSLSLVQYVQRPRWAFQYIVIHYCYPSIYCYNSMFWLNLWIFSGAFQVISLHLQHRFIWFDWILTLVIYSVVCHSLMHTVFSLTKCVCKTCLKKRNFHRRPRTVFCLIPGVAFRLQKRCHTASFFTKRWHEPKH